MDITNKTMPRPKLKKREVRAIKRMLLEKNDKGKKVYPQEYIASVYGVSRGTISKINKGIIDPKSPNARWGDIVLDR
jgi:DNA-binding XRE family transcriptional regulator